MSLFPLVRRLSSTVTPVPARLSISPNFVTAVSLVTGLACAWYLMEGDRQSSIVGAVLLVVFYVLDNCDGEIARLKQKVSNFGKHFDDVADALVHVCFFAALGLGTSRTTGADIWMWLGMIAAAGGAINSVVTTFLGIGDSTETTMEETADPCAPPLATPTPRGWKHQLVFFLRELARADFCFVVLFLAIFDLLWVLLPAAAIGAQVYWILRFVPGAGKYHV
jgi:phosphatidylglycerophosphate synthase